MGEVKAFLVSLYTAYKGLTYIVRSERNARIHLLIAILALALGLALGITDAQLVAVFFAIIIVFMAEVVNTAIEKLLDIIHPQRDERVRIIKDMAAGAVLVSAIGAFIIGVAIFGPYVVEL